MELSTLKKPQVVELIHRRTAITKTCGVPANAITWVLCFKKLQESIEQNRYLYNQYSESKIANVFVFNYL